MQKMHITTRHVTRRGARIAATGLLAGLLALTGAITPLTPTAHASGFSDATSGSTVRYQRGYTLQHGWLCYGWPSGAYRCTAHWRWQDGRLVSLNTAWLPNGLTLASVHTTARKIVAKAKAITYAASTRARANTYPWGQCTYWAAATARENLDDLGNARDWLWRARARGLATGYTPRVGATVVYAPGVQGASWLGHVAHVVAVYGGGRFLVSEMNYAGYGGGFGRVSYRTSWTQAGVSFIY